ncbi:MAG: hypothetical protein ACHQT7_01615 [Candidatus Levyibacteriota bacterium]
MKVEREQLRRRQHEVVYSEGQAGEIVERKVWTIFAHGAVITSHGIKEHPLNLSGQYAKKIESDKNHDPRTKSITKILESLPKGGTQEVFVIPQLSAMRLAIRPIPDVAPDVELISLKYGDSIILGMSLFGRYTYALLQGLIVECEKEMLEKDVNWGELGFSSRTLVKNALRRIAKRNGTDEEVGKRLAEAYKAAHPEDEWKEIEVTDVSDAPQTSEGDTKTS